MSESFKELQKIISSNHECICNNWSFILTIADYKELVLVGKKLDNLQPVIDCNLNENVANIIKKITKICGDLETNIICSKAKRLETSEKLQAIMEDMKKWS